MNEFDFLRQHGYGVVYGADEVKKKIIELGHYDPRKGKKMNAITEIKAEQPVDVFDNALAKFTVHTDGDVEITEGEEGVFVNDEGETRVV